MKSNEYDVIIIGAGIGGLVCGCLLAKSGKKVLIAERLAKTGGYCTSFNCKDFEFDAFVHSLGSLSPGGKLHKIFSSLNILEKMELLRFDPNDSIVAPDCRINYWNNLDKTIDDFSSVFPKEATNINCFFRSIINEVNLDSVANFRNKTFRQLLDGIFTDNKLKSVLSLLILGNMGVPAAQINSFIGIKHYKQFIMDSGFYPKSGIQTVPDVLTDRFRELGGDLFLSNEAKEIIIKKQVAKMVKLRDGRVLHAEYFVSNCDVRQTFFDLIGKEYLSNKIICKLSAMKPSMSLFIVYLGLKGNASLSLPSGVNSWMMFDYDYTQINADFSDYDFDDIKYMMIRPMLTKKNCMIFVNAPFKTHDFWYKNRKNVMDKVIEKAIKAVPDLAQSIVFKNAVDPSGLQRWTMNYRGAAYGWAGISEQFMDPLFTRDKVIKNLFLAGHWSTVAQGVSGVAITGERLANIILYTTT